MDTSIINKEKYEYDTSDSEFKKVGDVHKDISNINLEYSIKYDNLGRPYNNLKISKPPSTAITNEICLYIFKPIDISNNNFTKYYKLKDAKPYYNNYNEYNNDLIYDIFKLAAHDI